MTEKIQGGRPGSSMRWAFLEGFDIGTEGDPYLDRLRIVQTPLFGIYLHHIHRPDRDRDPHDHPWTFWSLVLDKSDPGAWKDKRRKRGSWHRMGREAAHMISDLDGPLWTLVLTGPRRAEWGFWPEGQFVSWREYTYKPVPM